MRRVVILLYLVVLNSIALVSGNVVPHTESDQWIATINQRHNVPSSNLQPTSVSGPGPRQPNLYPSIHKENPSQFASVHYGTIQHLPSRHQTSQTGHNSLISPQNEYAPDAATVPEPKPRNEDLFQEKLGFGMLSSLLPTSIFGQQNQPEGDSENLVDSDSDNNQISSTFLRNPSLFQQHDVDNANYMPTSSDGSSSVPLSHQESSQEAADTPGLFSRIRNALPFSKGLLSGLLSNDNNNSGEGGYVDDNGSNSLSLPFSNTNAHSEPSNNNPFSIRPIFQGLVNGGGDDETSNANTDENSESGSGTSFLSLIPNPFKMLTNLLPNINFESDEQPSEGGYDDSVPDPGDSSITPLQSISDGGLSGVLGAVVPYLSHVVTALGVTKAKLPLIKLMGAILGPILATAIAAMVIGLVYVSFYIVANGINNEAIEGEMYLLSFKQLLGILGIPDPLEELFDITLMRSLQERSISSRSLKQENSTLTNWPSEEIDRCIERLACHAIGKKLMSKPGMRHGWVEKGIKWVAGDGDALGWNIPKNNSYSKFIRYGKSLVNAVAVGMDPVSVQSRNPDSANICARYACNPINSLRKILSSK